MPLAKTLNRVSIHAVASCEQNVSGVGNSLGRHFASAAAAYVTKQNL